MQILKMYSQEKKPDNVVISASDFFRREIVETRNFTKQIIQNRNLDQKVVTRKNETGKQKQVSL